MFEECGIGERKGVGEEGEGFKIGMMRVEGGRKGIAGEGVGIGEGGVDAGVNYGKEGKELGKGMIEKEGIGFKLGDMGRGIEG